MSTRPIVLILTLTLVSLSFSIAYHINISTFAQGTGSDQNDTSIIVPAGSGGEGSTPMPDKSIIHTGETFKVQWQAQNKGSGPSQAFDDLLQINRFTDPASDCADNVDHSVVYNSEKDATSPSDFSEPSIPQGQTGPPMSTTVGPFDQPGKYQLSVVLGGAAQHVYNVKMGTNCIDIIQGDTNSSSSDTGSIDNSNSSNSNSSNSNSSNSNSSNSNSSNTTGG